MTALLWRACVFIPSHMAARGANALKNQHLGNVWENDNMTRTSITKGWVVVLVFIKAVLCKCSAFVIPKHYMAVYIGI